MTEEQWIRTQDFARRAARTWFRDNVEPSPEWIAEAVDDFLSWLEQDFAEFDNWDQGPVYVCDRASEWETEYCNYAGNCEYLFDEVGRRWHAINEEIGNFEVADELETDWYDFWSSPVRCCVRAAIDIASAPSAGVLGFTVADIKAMYPEGVPDWVKGPDGPDSKWCPWLQPDHDESDCHTFDEMPDSMGLVL